MTKNSGLVFVDTNVWLYALIRATAVRAGATLFYSEDLHDGLLVAEKLRIVNPFASLKK
ncbi:MAG: hypothetical protein ACREFE_12480 [Limisphaerales bacterium]